MASIAHAWVKVIGMIFSLAFIWGSLDNVVQVTLYDLAESQGADMTVMNTLMYVWQVLPFLWTAAGLLYGIVYTIRQGGEGQYY